MVVEDKIQEAKDCFDEIVKSGYNSYQKFKYIELKDLNPIIRKVCRKFKLRTNFDWNLEENRMYLKITDKEDKSEYIANIPTAPITASDPGKYMQDVGRVQTYAQRYLYVQVFEIAVPDNIDNQDQKKQQVHKQKKQPTPKKQIKQEPKEDATLDVVSTERVKEILDKAYTTVTIDAGKEFNLGTALWTLKRLCENDEELQACKDALKLYTADKVKEGANTKHD